MTQGSIFSYFNNFQKAQYHFKFSRDLSEEITEQVDSTKNNDSQIHGLLSHLNFIENKNFKIESYLNLAENYSYEFKHEEAIRSYKKLMQLAWKEKDNDMELKAFHGMAV